MNSAIFVVHRQKLILFVLRLSTRQSQKVKTRSVYLKSKVGSTEKMCINSSNPSVEEAGGAASAFTASINSAYRLSTHKLTLSDLNNELSGLDHLL